MKLLLTYDDRIRQDSTAVYFYHAFSKLCDVVKVYPEELPYINPKSFDLFVKIDDGLFPTYFPPEFHPSVYYVIDTHINAKQRQEVVAKSRFDYVFCAQKRGAEMSWESQNVSFLPLGCDPEFHSIPVKQYKKYDICFIGNVQPGWQQRRVDRLDVLFKAIPNFYFGNVFFKEAARKYAESKLVFNSAYSDDINMRFFEVMCSGSCLLTDKQDWQGLFQPGVHFLQYSSDKQMIEIAKYYIENNNEREKIAQQGKDEVLKNHKYLHRAKEILKTCKVM